MSKNKEVGAYEFLPSYLKKVKKDVFIKDNKHLSHLPLAEIWEEAHKK